jgi:hypothetical protein
MVQIIFDEDNSIIKIGRDKKDFSKLPQRDMIYTNLTTLPPGKYKCRLVIRNPETGRGAVASSSVIVPKNGNEGIKLYPPLLLKEAEEATNLWESSVAYPYDPNRYVPVIEGLGPDTTTLWAAVRCSILDAQTPDIKLSANIIHHSSDAGTSVPANITILERFHDGDTEMFFLEIQTAGLKPGKYFLYLFASDSPTGSRSGTNTTFEVR